MFLARAIAASRRRIFDPLSLSPALWLDASDSATLFNAASGGSTPANGAGIGRWEDKSGNGRNFTQSTSGSRPLRQTAVQNGLDVVRFDGSNDIMLMSAGLGVFADVPGITWVAVVKWLTTPTLSSVFASASTGSALAGRNTIGAGLTSRKSRCSARRNDADAQFVQAGTNDVPSAFYFQAAVTDYQNRTMRQWVNGTEEASDTSILTSGNTENSSSAAISVGAFQSGLAFSHIDIAELFAFSRAISDADLSELRSHLTTKWI
jgi:hypothetical protein